MLDLRVVISTTEGTLLYRNSEKYTDIQVHVAYGISESDDQSWKVQIHSKVHYLRDITAVMAVNQTVFGTSLACGRVPWCTALSDTFGSHFDRLKIARRPFGKALGCAARIFEATKNAESGFDGIPALSCASYFSSSYGKGFVRFAVKIFPELKFLREEMDVGVGKPVDEALIIYELSLSTLKSFCQCTVCKGESEDAVAQNNFCLVYIVETIAVVIRSLSGITTVNDLEPLLNGIEACYRQQELLHLQDADNKKEYIEKLGKVRYILELGDSPGKKW